MPFGTITKSVITRGMKPRARAAYGIVTAPKQKRALKKIAKDAIKNLSELKYYGIGMTYTDLYATNAFSNAAAGPMYQYIVGMSQGQADNQRIGDKAYIESIHVRGVVQSASLAGTAVYNLPRLMVFQKKAPSSTAPVITELFNTNSITGIVSSFSHRNLDFLGQYTMLYDKQFLIANNNSAATSTSNPSNTAKHFEFYVPMKYAKRELRYSNAGVESDQPIYIAATSDVGPSGAGNPKIAWQIRVRFRDI